ncbi:spore coat U domain-containing protein [Phenylobacterium sp. J367]|uniref:Csu type fimbrial protein n=1 Tax=Phenylobacterium sp. J367 TaxID=2898435 RepID=UPI002151BE27|nr:spore coat U domain-containing protein [Phenylobacterium sp. J367]MCR5877507.1 spore coat U domain-containing protein [Phenylobacterium sp. J367]
MPTCFRMGTILAAMSLGLALAQPAAGQEPDAVGTLQVRARLEASCSVTLQDLDFGEYRAASASQVKTVIEVRCTPGVRFNVALDGGGAGDADLRRMTGAGELSYQLYVDASHRRIFGDATGGETVSMEANGKWQRVNVYGSVPKGQSPPPGGFYDTVTMTLTY